MNEYNEPLPDDMYWKKTWNPKRFSLFGVTFGKSESTCHNPDDTSLQDTMKNIKSIGTTKNVRMFPIDEKSKGVSTILIDIRGVSDYVEACDRILDILPVKSDRDKKDLSQSFKPVDAVPFRHSDAKPITLLGEELLNQTYCKASFWYNNYDYVIFFYHTPGRNDLMVSITEHHSNTRLVNPYHTRKIARMEQQMEAQKRAYDEEMNDPTAGVTPEDVYNP